MSLSPYTAETIKHTAIAYKYKISTQSKIIYTSVLIIVTGILLALPFIKVKISVKSMGGGFQPLVEKQQLFAPITGRITKLMIRDNQSVKKGDTLLLMDASLPRTQGDLLQTRLSQLNQNLQDVDRIIYALGQDKLTLRLSDLRTGQYQASWQQYVQELKTNYLEKEQAERIYKRHESLYQNQVLTAAEFEKYTFDFEQAKAKWVLVSKNYKSKCQIEASQYRNELRQLQSTRQDYNEQEKQRVFKAPLDGSIQNMIGLHDGSYVIASQKIAEISPAGGLFAYCYLKPSDIGLIHKGQGVRFQVDAFQYNQWGILTGKVIDVADDASIINNQLFFKVKCSLDKNYLELKSGYKGYIKKGMTFTARFTVTERSLYQLLYDKIDNWIKPKQTQNISQKKSDVSEE